MQRQIQAVTFDAGGTLIHLVEPVGESYSRVAREFEIEADPATLERFFREVWKETPPPFISGAEEGVSERSWWKLLVGEVFARSLASRELTSSSIFDQFFDRLYDHFAEPGVWELDPDALEVLDEIGRRGVRSAIISNFDERLLKILADLEVLDRFDPLVISNNLNFSKPHPAIFQFAIDQLDLPAEAILHVGDDPVSDVEGATALGMQSFLVGRGKGQLIEILSKLPLAER